MLQIDRSPYVGLLKVSDLRTFSTLLRNLWIELFEKLQNAELGYLQLCPLFLLITVEGTLRALVFHFHWRVVLVLVIILDAGDWLGWLLEETLEFSRLSFDFRLLCNSRKIKCVNSCTLAFLILIH